MFILGNFLYGVAVLLQGLLTIYWWMLIVKCVISWVSPDPYNQIVMTLNKLTEPVLAEVRRKLPFIMFGTMDFSPILLLFVIQFLQSFLVKSLFDIALRLR